MEGRSGSSREFTVNSSNREAGGEGCTSAASHVADDDDSLLDLSEPGPDLTQSENRLFFDLTSDPETRERGGESHTERVLSEGVTGTLSGFVSAEIGSLTSAATAENQSITTSSGREADFHQYVSGASKNTDTFSYGVPVTFSQSGFKNSYMERKSPPTNTVITTSMPSESVTQQSRSSATSEQTRPTAGHVFPGHSRYADVDERVNSALTEELPDVSLKQPLLQSHPRATADTEAHSAAIRDSHSAAQRPRGSQAGRKVMLDSLPPPPRPGSVTGGEGSSHGEAGAEEIHCHSATSRHNMNDRLARRQLLAVLVLCVLFMIGEIIGGVLSNSLALFTDVLHLASDLISYVISLLALYLSRKQATRRMTFGYHRAEVLGALFSVFIIWLVSGVLCYIAVERIVNKHYMDVKPNEMLITASLGVLFNLIMGFVLHSEKCCGIAKSHSKFGHGHSHAHGAHAHNHSTNSTSFEYEPLDVASNQEGGEEEEEESHPQPQQHKNINVRAAFIHVVGDIIQSLGVLVAALIIKLKEDEKYRLADPICTFFFSLLVLCTTVNVLRDTLRIIMEGTPQAVDFEQLKRELMSVDSVVTLHNLHIWALTMDRNALSVHLAIEDADKSGQVLKEAITKLKQHNFYHLTIQVEPYNDDVMAHCSHCQLLVN